MTVPLHLLSDICFCNRERRVRGVRSRIVQYRVWRETVYNWLYCQSSYSRRNASIQGLCVCCVRADVGGISWRVSFMVMMAAGSCEGCFQVPRIRQLFPIHFPLRSTEQTSRTRAFHRNVTHFIINKRWIVVCHRVFLKGTCINIIAVLIDWFSHLSKRNVF